MANYLLILCGPTATGKTDLAVDLAKKFKGEIVSADSRQIYQGMDIGTGKDIPQNAKFIIQNSRFQLKNQNYSIGFYKFKNIPVWLLDIVNPDQSFSVANYQKFAQLVIQDIWNRKKLPILTGGTGLYIKAVTEGIDTLGIPPDYKLREELEKLSLEKLQNKLKVLNLRKWESMTLSDQKNPRRLIRAIEIAQAEKKQILSNVKKDNQSTFFAKLQENILFLGLLAPRKILFQKIDERVEKRVQKGIIGEIKSLLKKGYSCNLPSMSGLGYRLWKDYFEKKKTLKETIQAWKNQEHAYARRQLTWFRKNKRIKWFDISKADYKKDIFISVKNFLLPCVSDK